MTHHPYLHFGLLSTTISSKLIRTEDLSPSKFQPKTAKFKFPGLTWFHMDETASRHRVIDIPKNFVESLNLINGRKSHLEIVLRWRNRICQAKNAWIWIGGTRKKTYKTICMTWTTSFPDFEPTWVAFHFQQFIKIKLKGDKNKFP